MSPLDIISIEQDIAVLPMVYPYSRNFWDGLIEGRFRFQVCTICSAKYFPPQISCNCGSSEIGWCDASGKGSLYSLTFVHAGVSAMLESGPYGIAIVDLEEGLRIACAWIGSRDVPLDSGVELAATRHSNGYLYVARESHR